LRLTVVSPFLDRQHGTELCILEQIERLASEYGWEIHLYSQRVEGVAAANAELSSPSSLPRIHWHKVSEIPGPHLLKYLWWFAANHFQRWGDNRDPELRPELTYSPGINCLDADVIVVHIVFHEFYARVKPELRLLSLPWKSWLRVIHRKLYYRLIMTLEKRIHRDPRVGLIAVSQLVADQLNTHFGRKNVSVIPDAIDTRRFSLPQRLARRYTTRQSFRFTESEFVLLLIGNDWKKKGLDSLLQAMGQLRDLPLRLLVVGKDDPSLYEPHLAKNALQERVRFELPSADVLRFYAAADLYVAPSLEDAFGLPILEAMACGLPVIASVRAGASENICDAETGFLLQDPRDHGQLARLIRQIVGDPALGLRIGEAASRFAKESCGWESNTRQTRDQLEAILFGRRGK
jgi:glycosyltransferase involved in cell wall biosynthesis